jgi:hypothetical protein
LLGSASSFELQSGQAGSEEDRDSLGIVSSFSLSKSNPGVVRMLRYCLIAVCLNFGGLETLSASETTGQLGIPDGFNKEGFLLIPVYSRAGACRRSNRAFLHYFGDQTRSLLSIKSKSRIAYDKIEISRHLAQFL